MSDKFANNKFSVMAGGKEVTCDILFKFHCEMNGKDYMAFTDHSKDRAGNPSIFYATYDPDAEDISLAPIQSEQEWMMVRDMMEQLQEDAVYEMRKKLMEAHQAAEAEEAAKELKTEE